MTENLLIPMIIAATHEKKQPRPVHVVVKQSPPTSGPSHFPHKAHAAIFLLLLPYKTASKAQTCMLGIRVSLAVFKSKRKKLGEDRDSPYQ